jgi:hypothetical protein
MMISEKDAMELLRKGRLLTRMHTKVGLKWFVIPGGQIADTSQKKSSLAGTSSRTMADCSRIVRKRFR